MGHPAHGVMVGFPQRFLHAQSGLFAQAARFLSSIPSFRKTAFSSLRISHSHMLRICRTWSKCLIWVAALMSPTQTLQATHVICRVGATRVDKDETADKSNQLGCHCKHVQGRSLQREQVANALGHHDGTRDGTEFPCHCPPDCWCWRPAEPLWNSSRPLQCKTPFELATLILVADFVDCCPSRRLIHYRTDHGHITPVSALEQCAGLCRFLI